jgi:uncharacterized protein YjcR
MEKARFCFARALLWVLAEAQHDYTAEEILADIPESFRKWLYRHWGAKDGAELLRMADELWVAQRVRKGLKRAQETGKQLGRPSKLGSKGIAEAQALYRQGYSLSQIAERIGVSVSTAHRYCCAKVEEDEGAA